MTTSVLNTRIEADGYEAVLNAGHMVTNLPLLTIVPRRVRTVALRSATAAVFFVSTHAVHHGVRLFLKSFLSHSHIFAAGKRTANALAQQGLTVTAVATHGIAALSAHPAVRQHSHAVIVKGVYGRRQLYFALKKRGHAVQTVTCYARSCPQYSNAQLACVVHAQHVIVVTSGTILHNLCRVFHAHHDWLFRQSLVVIDSRIATMARKIGFTQTISVARDHTHNALIDTLLSTKQ